MATTVMIVEDEGNIGTLVRTYLQRAGYTVVWVRSGEEALTELRRHPVRLVVLDIGLPGIDGFEVCRRIGGAVPVIMLTARDEEPDRVAGLEVGADDYVVKPFSPRELTARVKAVLRRAGRPAATDTQEIYELGPLRVLSAAREVTVAGADVQLTQREFDLLEFLVRHSGQVVTRDQLLASVWGFISPGETRTVEVHVASLRKKLGRPELIRTVRGVGYKATA
ncbi:MAG TPA: response regulator transcription factor [Solirubrobacteraceae bacterium]|nr:response regulator transcription factor [Solirubrobacteraceae bacterium]